MQFRIATFLIAAYAVSMGVAAQNAPASSNKRTYAEHVVAAQQGAEMDRLIQQLAGSAVQPMLANWGPKLEANVPATRQKAAAEQLNGELNRLGDDAVGIIKSKVPAVSSGSLVDAYLSKFTEDELRQLDAFFSAPVIKKYQTLAPELGNLMVEKLIESSRGEIQARSAQFDEAARKIVGPDKAAAPKASGSDKPASKAKTQP